MSIPTFTKKILPVSGDLFSNGAKTLNSNLANISSWVASHNTYLTNTGLENQYFQAKSIRSKQFYPQAFRFLWSNYSKF